MDIIGPDNTIGRLILVAAFIIGMGGAVLLLPGNPALAGMGASDPCAPGTDTASGPTSSTDDDTSRSPASGGSTAFTSQAGCVGGGECYTEKVTAGDADLTVSASASRGDLQSTLDEASRGDVVFVDPGAEINLGYFPDQPSITVPAGVTLASNRGIGGASGALLYGEMKPGSEWQGADTIVVNDDVRITGLRIEGPTPDREKEWLGADHDYTDAISANGASNVVIDNNELYGWPHAAVSGGDPVHVHHNFIHDNDQSGLGYGVSSPQWDSVIEYNLFDTNRHAIAASGSPGDGYIARFNVFGSDCVHSHHRIDMHADDDGGAGEKIAVYRNTVEIGDSCSGEAVNVRGTPAQRPEVYQNWFHHSGPDAAFSTDDFDNYDTRDNQYGTGAPSSCDIGAPRDSC
jgi:hypothetical protein